MKGKEADVVRSSEGDVDVKGDVVVEGVKGEGEAETSRVLAIINNILDASINGVPALRKLFRGRDSSGGRGESVTDGTMDEDEEDSDGVPSISDDAFKNDSASISERIERFACPVDERATLILADPRVRGNARAAVKLALAQETHIPWTEHTLALIASALPFGVGVASSLVWETYKKIRAAALIAAINKKDLSCQKTRCDILLCALGYEPGHMSASKNANGEDTPMSVRVAGLVVARASLKRATGSSVSRLIPIAGVYAAFTMGADLGRIMSRADDHFKMKPFSMSERQKCTVLFLIFTLCKILPQLMKLCRMMFSARVEQVLIALATTMLSICITYLVRTEERWFQRAMSTVWSFARKHPILLSTVALSMSRVAILISSEAFATCLLRSFSAPRLTDRQFYLHKAACAASILLTTAASSKHSPAVIRAKKMRARLGRIRFSLHTSLVLWVLWGFSEFCMGQQSWRWIVTAFNVAAFWTLHELEIRLRKVEVIIEIIGSDNAVRGIVDLVTTRLFKTVADPQSILDWISTASPPWHFCCGMLALGIGAFPLGVLIGVYAATTGGPVWSVFVHRPGRRMHLPLFWTVTREAYKIEGEDMLKSRFRIFCSCLTGTRKQPCGVAFSLLKTMMKNERK